jgi:hypothetical protein
MPVERSIRAAAIELGCRRTRRPSPSTAPPADGLRMAPANAVGTVGEWIDRRAGTK